LVERFRALVAERAHLGQGLAELTRSLGVTARQLAAACRAELGQLPSAVLDAERMALAERWLREQPTLPVQQVARWSGYTDHSAFGRRFRQQHGCSPQAWRARTAPPEAAGPPG
jgi:AraC-like DNA-binding protein